MTESFEYQSGDMTATLAAVAAVLSSLPLDAYRTAMAREIREAAGRDYGDEPELASATHRRARRGALLAAVAAARDFVGGMHEAMHHNRATARAVELESAAQEEQRAADHPGVVLPMRTLRPRTGNLMHDTFPGAKVIPMRLEEALTGDDPA